MGGVGLVVVARVSIVPPRLVWVVRGGRPVPCPVRWVVVGRRGPKGQPGVPCVLLFVRHQDLQIAAGEKEGTYILLWNVE